MSTSSIPDVGKTLVENHGQGDGKRGAKSSITPPETSQNEFSGPLNSGGEDTMILSIGVDWGEGYEGLMESINDARATAEREHSMQALAIAGRLFGVHPGGMMTGDGKGLYFAYRLESGGYKLRFMRRKTPIGESPNVMVHIGSLTLMMLNGFRSTWEEVQLIISELGGQLRFAKVSRADLCVDLAEVDVNDFILPIINGHHICRAKKEAFYKENGQWTGIFIGGDKVSLRIYDKAYEVRRDATKKLILAHCRWGCVPEKATRVEFQLRREALKERGIDTVDDYLRLLPALGTYLVEEWFRLADSPVDRENNHQARAELAPVWIKTQKAFIDWTGKSEESLPKPTPRLSSSVDPYMRQALGCLSTAICLRQYEELQGEIPSRWTFLEWTQELLSDLMELEPEKFADNFGSKLLKVMVQRPKGEQE